MSPEEAAGLVREFEDEINNGGFHQFFNNSSGDNSTETVFALEIIGALTTADIVKRAIARFPEGIAPKDRKARLELLWENFPTTHEFDDLDAEFWPYPDDLSALLATHLEP
jgi:hypothetical protein